MYFSSRVPAQDCLRRHKAIGVNLHLGALGGNTEKLVPCQLLNHCNCPALQSLLLFVITTSFRDHPRLHSGEQPSGFATCPASCRKRGGQERCHAELLFLSCGLRCLSLSLSLSRSLCLFFLSLSLSLVSRSLCLSALSLSLDLCLCRQQIQRIKSFLKIQTTVVKINKKGKKTCAAELN